MKKIYILIFGLFALSLFLYANIGKLPLTHPGNLKAADPFYHALCTEEIVDSKQWNYYDRTFSLGNEKIVNTQPPLLYLNSAVLSIFSGMPAWVTIYFLACFFYALLVLLSYILVKEVFEKESIAIMTAGFSVLPLSVHAWLYSLYIGFWLQVAAYTLIICFFWLFIRYLKRQELWSLFFMGVCISSIIMIHPMDLSMIIIPCLIVLIKIVANGDIKNILIKGFSFGLFPLIMIIPLIPRFLYVWGAMGGSQFKFGIYGLHSNMYSRVYGGGLVFPDIFFIPLPILILFGIGFIQLILNFKKYRIWILSSVYYFSIIYILPVFVENPYYFGRARALTPFFVFPVVAYTIYYFGLRFLKNTNKENIAAIIIGVMVISIGYPSYQKIVDNMKYEHITYEKWQAYKWIMENSEESDKVLFFGFISQSENIYVKRINALITTEDIISVFKGYLEAGVVPIDIKVGWGGDTVRSGGFQQKAWNKYERLSEPSPNASIYDFDYIFFQNLNKDIEMLNRAFIDFYLQNGFRKVYDNSGYIIIKNEKKKT